MHVTWVASPLRVSHDAAVQRSAILKVHGTTFSRGVRRHTLGDTHMLSELLKLLWGSVRERAGRLVSLLRKGWDWLREQFRGITADKLVRPRILATTSVGQSIGRLHEQAQAVLRAKREHARANNRAAPPPSPPETSGAAERQAHEKQAVRTHAASDDASPRDESAPKKATKTPARVTDALARSGSLLTHPPQWLREAAPLIARSIVRKYGTPKCVRVMPRFPEISLPEDA